MPSPLIDVISQREIVINTYFTTCEHLLRGGGRGAFASMRRKASRRRLRGRTEVECDGAATATPLRRLPAFVDYLKQEGLLDGSV